MVDNFEKYKKDTKTNKNKIVKMLFFKPGQPR